MRGALLFDRNSRGQPFDAVYIGLLHAREELAGIRRQGFDVTALPLGEDSVESERGFAGSGQAGDHGQLVARDVQVDVVEIVRPCSADPDLFHVGLPCS